MGNSNTAHSRKLRQATAAKWEKEKRENGERVYFPSVLMTPEELDEIKGVTSDITKKQGGGLRVALLALVRFFKERSR